MELLKGYVQSDEELSDPDDSAAISLENCKSLPLSNNLSAAPDVLTKSILKQVAIVDPRTKEIKTNPTYEQLFQPEAGPSNPFKSENQKAQKNVITGFVEPAHINDFHFTRELRSFDTLGYARNPTADKSYEFIGDIEAATKNQGESLFDSKKTGGEKRKRMANFDSSDIEGYTGPWARYNDEITVAKPDPELQKEMDEITRKRQANSRRFKRKQQQQNESAEETSVLHLKEAQDYQGRSFLVPPAFTGVNLRADAAPEKCFIPKKQIHVYKGHTKGVNCVQWFPKSAHLFLSCSMDTKIKLWEVYGKHQVVRTYSGHKLPVREVAFNNEGTEFLSASFDRYVKLWDTETGQVKQRFHTGHIPFCVKFHPDDDKNHMFLAGMQNKKIVQWDSRSGEIVQEYDRHLGPVNSITFFDKNRRFASTSDDKSIRIWEWEIPVDTKLIQNVGLHSIPTMNKKKWVVGQSMDNRIVLFQLIDEKLRFAKKKAFRGHNSAGYACVTDFSPDMSYLISGDADGKLFIWDWRTHKIVARWKAHDNTCISARWHPKEKSKILTAGWDSVIKMWA
ncbi:WD domain, G-beta repeat protein [Dictyocaulus viviparus]|uniref:Pre-mRNA-processing factor 17 n=1 Tax=Dictyocaulus viviparus TaxID=29172 RepID=A0A0D8XMA4_DICVI|nr:WD domain, G-beta repeat protein [Dictyocaulus viviparus]